jgi:hypothetical protein
MPLPRKAGLLARLSQGVGEGACTLSRYLYACTFSVHDRPVRGGPQDRTRVVFEALRTGQSVVAVARALRVTRQTVHEHRRRALKILTPFVAEATRAGVVLFRVCWQCGIRPKQPGQSLCRGWRREYIKAWRRRKAAAEQEGSDGAIGAPGGDPSAEA